MNANDRNDRSDPISLGDCPQRHPKPPIKKRKLIIPKGGLKIRRRRADYT